MVIAGQIIEPGLVGTLRYLASAAAYTGDSVMFYGKCVASSIGELHSAGACQLSLH